jgi:hypothetical protein
MSIIVSAFLALRVQSFPFLAKYSPAPRAYRPLVLKSVLRFARFGTSVLFLAPPKGGKGARRA